MTWPLAFVWAVGIVSGVWLVMFGVMTLIGRKPK